MEVMYEYIKGKLNDGSEEMPQKGHGKIVTINNERYGVYRDKENHLYIVDITCTHLGCELKFNKEEKTWDCPCHGSRFSYKGEVLNGPALKPLKFYGEGKNDIEPKLL